MLKSLMNFRGCWYQEEDISLLGRRSGRKSFFAINHQNAKNHNLNIKMLQASRSVGTCLTSNASELAVSVKNSTAVNIFFIRNNNLNVIFRNNLIFNRFAFIVPPHLPGHPSCWLQIEWATDTPLWNPRPSPHFVYFDFRCREGFSGIHADCSGYTWVGDQANKQH